MNHFLTIYLLFLLATTGLASNITRPNIPDKSQGRGSSRVEISIKVSSNVNKLWLSGNYGQDTVGINKLVNDVFLAIKTDNVELFKKSFPTLKESTNTIKESDYSASQKEEILEKIQTGMKNFDSSIQIQFEELKKKLVKEGISLKMMTKTYEIREYNYQDKIKHFFAEVYVKLTSNGINRFMVLECSRIERGWLIVDGISIYE